MLPQFVMGLLQDTSSCQITHELHTKKKNPIKTQPTNAIEFVIKDSDELVRTFAGRGKFYPEGEEGGDHSVVCEGPTPCVHDSCMLMIWLLDAGGDTRLRSVFVSLLQGN